MKKTKEYCETENDSSKLEDLKLNLKDISNVNFEKEINCIKQKVKLLIESESKVANMNSQSIIAALDQEIQEK